MDRDGDGRISLNELKLLLETVGLAEKTAVRLFESLKGTHGDSIDYKMFLATYAPALCGTSDAPPHGRVWPRDFKMLRHVPSAQGHRWCLY
jgi:hypothetical protein